MMFSVRGGPYYSALIEPRDENNSPDTKGGLQTDADSSLYSGKGVLLCDQALDTNRKASLITPTTTTTTNTTISTHIITTTTSSSGSAYNYNNSSSNNLLNNNNQLNNDHHSGGSTSSGTPGLRFQSASLDSSSSSSGARSLLCTSGGSSHKSGSSPLSLTSIKAAWKSLTSITSSSSSKLPHLERHSDAAHSQTSTSGGSQASSSQQDYRYTQVPSSASSALHILANKRHKDNSAGTSGQHQSLHNTHIYLTPASRSYTHPHRSPLQPPPSSHSHHHHHHHHHHLPGSSHHGSSSFRATLSSQSSRSGNFSGSSVSRATGEALTLAKCLRKHREKQQKIHEQALTRKSKSDNALQKIGVNLKSQSDQNLHKVWLVGGAGGSQASCCATNNSIFSTVQLSGGSGDSTASVASSSNSNCSYRKKRRRLLAGIGIEEEIRRREEQEEREERSRSLERHHGQRISSSSSSSSSSRRHTRSLERNHKFRVDLRHLIPSPPLCSHLEPVPPDHQAPSPPTHTAPFIPHSSSTSGSSSCSQQSFSPCVASPSLGSYPSSSSNTYSPTPHETPAVNHCRLACLTATAGNILSNSWCSSGSSGSSSSGASSCGVEGKICSGMEAGASSGSFINKPARGWLHTDTQLADGGVSYAVRYIGCLEVNTSMKSLNFDTRSLIAKECISRVCEAAGLKTADRRRKTMKTIGRILGETPLMQHAGSNVTLTITSAALTLTLLDNGALIAHHDMPNISFASGGDPDTLDFIAYVAKDCRYGRACFVLECGGGQAQNVITSIGQAFELRFKEYLKKTPQTQGGVAAAGVAGAVAAVPTAGAEGGVQHGMNSAQHAAAPGQPTVNYTTVSKDRLPGNVRTDDPEYYNDLPGKVPPDIIPPSGQPPPVPPLPSLPSAVPKVTSGPVGPPEDSSKGSNGIRGTELTSPPSGEAPRPPSASGVGNLIDLSNGGSTEPFEGSSGQLPRSEPEYVNDSIIKQSQQSVAEQAALAKDPFDMQPFSTTLSHLDASSTVPKSLSVQQRMQLAQELWYHGPINRKQAEDLLKQDGDFLVRESQGTAGQFVLTGMQNNIKKHLLLVDPNGVVRTKCQTFSSVSHLINYHRDNELPIVSAESALVLRHPVIRRTTPPQPR